MTQLNTPYPSTAYITGFLREQGIDAVQHDLALATVLELLSKPGLAQLQAAALATDEATRSAAVNSFLDHASSYISTIDPTIAFLQGRDSTLCHRIPYPKMRAKTHFCHPSNTETVQSFVERMHQGKTMQFRTALTGRKPCACYADTGSRCRTRGNFAFGDCVGRKYYAAGAFPLLMSSSLSFCQWRSHSASVIAEQIRCSLRRRLMQVP